MRRRYDTSRNWTRHDAMDVGQMSLSLRARSRSMRRSESVCLSTCNPIRRWLTWWSGIALTARTEAQLASQGPATTDLAKSAITALIPPLRTASGSHDVLPEDAFEAAVCLAWIHWLGGEYQLAVARLPDDFAVVLKGFLEGARTIGQWVRVCAVRGAYIKGRRRTSIWR